MLENANYRKLTIVKSLNNIIPFMYHLFMALKSFSRKRRKLFKRKCGRRNIQRIGILNHANFSCYFVLSSIIFLTLTLGNISGSWVLFQPTIFIRMTYSQFFRVWVYVPVSCMFVKYTHDIGELQVQFNTLKKNLYFVCITKRQSAFLLKRNLFSEEPK